MTATAVFRDGWPTAWAVLCNRHLPAFIQRHPETAWRTQSATTRRICEWCRDGVPS